MVFTRIREALAGPKYLLYNAPSSRELRQVNHILNNYFTIDHLLRFAESRPRDPILEAIAENLHFSDDNGNRIELDQKDRLKLIDWVARNIKTDETSPYKSKNKLAEALIIKKHPIFFNPQTPEDRMQIVKSFNEHVDDCDVGQISRDIIYELGQRVVETAENNEEAREYHWAAKARWFWDGVTTTYGFRIGTLRKYSDGTISRSDGLTAEQWLRARGL